jgi:endonuclease I
MKKTFFLFINLSFALMVSAQPTNYYNSANGLTGNQLKEALHNIVKGHESISYSQLWNAFWSTDNKGNGVVWDMYSDRPNGTPPYTYQLGSDQCGNFNSEGDCYNREHSWPSSWFNDQSTPRTDLHHIFPTDGFVNNKRANYPFGEVRSASWTSQNGSKLGTCKTPGYSGTVFEPIDEYKGDFARALMYMSVRYHGEDSGWGTSDMTEKSEIKPWAINMLMRWNDQDPVSEKEKERNEAIYNDYQRNRNPFIDHPEYARMIWDASWSLNESSETMVYLFPNPIEAGQTLQLSGNNQQFDAIVICDLSGRTLLKATGNAVGDGSVALPNDFAKGCYIVKLMRNNAVVKYEKLLVK